MKRPTAVTVFGVLNIVWAGFGFICIPLGALGMAFSQDQMHEIIKESRVYTLWTWIYMGIGLIGSGIQLATGIGLLRLRPWARTLAVYYSGFSLVIGILGMILDTLLFYRPALEQFSSQQAGPEAVGMFVGIGLGVLISLLALVYAVALIVVLTRPRIVAAFEQARVDGTRAPEL